MSRPHIHRSASGSIAPVIVLVAVAAIAPLLAACGGANGSLSANKSGTKLTGTSAPTEPPPVPQSRVQKQSAQILAAWNAAMAAFETASRAADPDAPAIRATIVPPELAKTWSLLESMRTAGYVMTGPVDHGNPVVLDVKANMATVRTCEWDAEILVSATTGQHALGLGGTKAFELVTSTMTLTAQGWKLADLTAQVEKKCQRA
jgi:hypothetical protein